MDKFIHKYKHYIDWDYKFISMKNLLLTCFFLLSILIWKTEVK